jgi:hypothetical protein
VTTANPDPDLANGLADFENRLLAFPGGTATTRSMRCCSSRTRIIIKMQRGALQGGANPSAATIELTAAVDLKRRGMQKTGQSEVRTVTYGSPQDEAFSRQTTSVWTNRRDLA